MPSSLSHRFSFKRGLFLATVLVVAMTSLALIWSSRAQDLPVTNRAAPAQQARPAPFAGASASRVFLTSEESRQAATKGLLPAATRSIIGTKGKLEYGAWRWDDRGVPAGRTHARVDLGRQLVSVFRGPHEIGTAVILYGMDGKETPRGRLPILGKTRDYHSRTYDAPMPFSLWLRKDGVALHGSTIRSGRATNGCIGVPVEFAGKLFEIARKGDIIEVVG